MKKERKKESRTKEREEGIKLEKERKEGREMRAKNGFTNFALSD